MTMTPERLAEYEQWLPGNAAMFTTMEQHMLRGLLDDYKAQAAEIATFTREVERFFADFERVTNSRFGTDESITTRDKFHVICTAWLCRDDADKRKSAELTTLRTALRELREAAEKVAEEYTGEYTYYSVSAAKLIQLRNALASACAKAKEGIK